MSLPEALYRYILRVEGTSFVHHPDDPGGATRYGITQVAYDNWNASLGFPPSPVENISEQEVKQIYESRYYLEGNCDRLTWPYNLLHFDGYVNLNPNRARKIFQQMLGVEADGEWGPITMGTYRDLLQRPVLQPYLVDRYLLMRALWYGHLARNQRPLATFLPGWLRRLEILRETALGGSP